MNAAQNWPHSQTDIWDTQSIPEENYEEAQSVSGTSESSYIETRSDPGRTFPDRTTHRSSRETQSDPGEALPEFEDLQSEFEDTQSDSEGSHSSGTPDDRFRLFRERIEKASELDWYATAYSEDARALRREVVATQILAADAQAKAENFREIAIATRRAAKEEFEESLDEGREMKMFKIRRRGGQSKWERG